MTKEEAKRVLISTLREINSDEQNISCSSEEFTEAMLLAIDALSKPSLPSDLEEAAKDYTDSSEWLIGENLEHIEASFIAGAKWQEEKEKEYSPWLAIPKLKEAALEFGEHAKDYEIGGQSFTEDMAVAFTRGAEWQKEQMMEEAVEGHITNAGGEFGYDVATFRFDDNHTYSVLLSHEEKRKYGDKARVIIVKDDEK